MFVKKVFQLVKPFLANLHSTVSKKYSIRKKRLTILKNMFYKNVLELLFTPIYL
jgi:hypothetical protein